MFVSTVILERADEARVHQLFRSRGSENVADVATDELCVKEEATAGSMR
jgi:hypothetical protein